MTHSTQDRSLDRTMDVDEGHRGATTLWSAGSSAGTTCWTVRRQDVFGVIEVGTTRARLDVFRQGEDGTLQAVWCDEETISAASATSPSTEEASTAPTGGHANVDDRLVSGLRRFQRVCGRHHVTLGAVVHASDTLNNHPETLPRLFRMTGVALKQVSDREAARLLCLGLLRGEAAGRKTLLVDVGAEATQVILAEGEDPVALWRLGVGTAGAPGAEAVSSVRHLRAEVRRSLHQTRLDAIRGATARALTGRAALERSGTGPTQGRVRAILEEVAGYLRLDGIRAVDRGLREGILFDLCRAAGRAVS